MMNFGHRSLGFGGKSRAASLIWERFGDVANYVEPFAGSVRVACGGWQRVLTDSVTWRHGTTGILLDPPYGEGSERAEVYAHDSAAVAADVRAWCLEHGPDKRLRICLCGYEGEGHEELARAGWDVVVWKAQGGYGGQRKKAKGGESTNENARRERLFFSPGCDRGRQGKLF